MVRGREVEIWVDEVAWNNQANHKDSSKLISVVDIGTLASNEPDVEDENSETG